MPSAASMYNRMISAGRRRFPYDGFLTYTAKFGGKALTFFGTSHERATQDVIRPLAKTFSAVRPDAILLEMPASRPMGYVEYLLGRPRSCWTSMEWAAHFAVMRGIPVKGDDLTEKEVLDAFLRLRNKDALKIALLWWLASVYIGRKDARDASASERYEESKKTLIGMFMKTGGYGVLSSRRREFTRLLDAQGAGTREEALERVIRYTSAKYVDASASPGELLESRNLHTPWPYSSFALGRFNAFIEASRNHSMLRHFSEAMEDYDRILAVGGIGHAVEIRPLLVKPRQSIP